jgi:hypothetical protein
MEIRKSNQLYYFSISVNTVGYARMNIIGSRTSFVIASVPSSIH